MDSGFDDLLAPSRDVMDNPFGDPFAQARSSSPDPWASFGTASAAPAFHEESLAFGGDSISPTHNAFADVGGFRDHEPQDYQSHDYAEEPSHTQDDSTKPHEEDTPTSPADPLDTAAFNAAEAVAEAEEAAAAAASTGLLGALQRPATPSVPGLMMRTPHAAPCTPPRLGAPRPAIRPYSRSPLPP